MEKNCFFLSCRDIFLQKLKVFSVYFDKSMKPSVSSHPALLTDIKKTVSEDTVFPVVCYSSFTSVSAMRLHARPSP